MRIGIDARELTGRPTGVGRYLEGLVHQWASADDARAHEFVLYTPEPLETSLDGRRFATRVVAGKNSTFWEQVRMPQAAGRDHLDVLFSPGYTTPLFRKVPSVVAIHDVSFAARPDWFRAREGMRRRWLSRQAAYQSAAIITISEFSRHEIVQRFSVAESKIHVIPPGVTVPRVPPSPQRDQATVLFTGSIFNRRHVPHLIRAFAIVARRHRDARLEIAGDNRSYPRQDLEETIRFEGLEGRARWRSWVSEEELARLYGRARAFAFLSEYEGLGLTPLEALAAGVPPVVLDTPVARESCGRAALYVGLDNLPATAAALEAALFDEQARSSVLSAAPEVLSRYNWSRAARETLALIEQVASRPR
jgi:glycosyltransferase involved in cell wall biosynthesis